MKLVATPKFKSSKAFSLATRVITETGIGENLGFCIIETDDSGDIGLLSGPADYGIYLPPSSSPEREEISEEVFVARNQRTCHIVWLSSRAFRLPPIKFSWVLAHEFGHVFQNVGLRPKIRNFRQVITRFRSSPLFVQLPPSCMCPNEIDSDLLAYETCAKIFSTSAVNEYINTHGIERCPFNQYNVLLQELRNTYPQTES
jgi:hypothetical protein